MKTRVKYFVKLLTIASTLLIMTGSLVEAEKKKPSKKAQKTECTFQFNRCLGVCDWNFQLDPNVKGNNDVYSACKDQCIASEKTCNEKISRMISPENFEELVPDDSSSSQ